MQWFADPHHIWIVPLYPLLAFILILLGRSFGGVRKLFPKPLAAVLTILATFLGLLHTMLGALPWLLNLPAGLPPVIEQNIPWLSAGHFTLSLGYLLDPMSVMMLFVVTFISLLIQIYTHGYMRHDPGYAKFFAYLALFNFSMLGLVLSTNLFQIYIFWELVGVSSYLLIGFWFTRPSAAAAAVKAFLMNRVGDFGFLFGILGFLLYSFSYWTLHPEVAALSFSSLPQALQAALPSAGPVVMTVIALLLFMGPMAKSAQLPLHTWLPDAMEGPTPISALIHAATMVAAGVYLIGRVYPIFHASQTAMMVVAAIGTLTALVAATIALVQYDIKKALAYSTMSQLGFMVAGMGVGAFTAGLFHLFTHAFFKAMLFLCSGSVIHACEDEQDMRKMGGLAAKLPLTHLTYLVGCLAISGLFWTSGFWSKDMILEGALHNPMFDSRLIYGALALTAGLTAFYMFRTYFLTFWGKYRGDAHVHHEDPWMTLPLLILAVPSLLVGAAMAGLADIHWLPSFAAYIHYALPGMEHVHPHTFVQAAFQNPVGVNSLIIGLTGAILAFILYTRVQLLPALIKEIPITAPVFRLFSKKWYFDELYQSFVDRIYLAFARASAGFDRSGIDGVVNGAARLVLDSGYALRELQSGKVQTYIAVLFFSLVALTLLLFYYLI